MQDQFIFRPGDTDPDLPVPVVADTMDMDVVERFGEHVVPTPKEMIKSGQQRRRSLGMPVSGPAHEAAALRFRNRVRVEGHAWRPRTSGTML